MDLLPSREILAPEMKYLAEIMPDTQLYSPLTQKGRALIIQKLDRLDRLEIKASLSSKERIHRVLLETFGQKHQARLT